MRVLVGCEFSGIVRDAFRACGHDAISCDLIETETPGPHIVGDVFEVIQPRYWDLIILHAPCTALSVSGNATYARGKRGWPDRLAAVSWTERLWHHAKKFAPRVCLENPVNVMGKLSNLPSTVFVQPHEHGDKKLKKTGLTLHNLPPLVPTTPNLLPPVDPEELKKWQEVWRMPPGPDRAKDRSRFFPGIAASMAEQWGAL